MSDLATKTLEECLRALETERQLRAQEIAELKASEQKYRHFFEKSPTMIYVVDRRGHFMNINQAGVRMLGLARREDVLQTSFRDYFFIDDTALTTYRDTIQRHGLIREFETQMRRADGTIRDVQITATLRTTVTGKSKGYEGFVIDITKRKITEKRLAESEAKYRTVLENSLAAIYMFQDGGYFSYANPQMVSLLGYDGPEEIIGKPFWEVVSPADREVVKKRGLRREKGEIYPRRYKFRMLKKDGSEIWVDMRSSHASYLGRPAVVGNFIDISKEKGAEEEIRQLSHRLIAVIEEERRSLAADLHDEFGQALTLLQLDLEALHNSLEVEQADPRRICQNVMVQIQRLAESIRDTTSRLRPDMLDHLGLVPTLEWYMADYRQRRPEIHVDFQCMGLKRRLDGDTELVLYRIFQEALNNIGRHAKARTVGIQLTYSHPQVIFSIKDDGVGFDLDGSRLPGRQGRMGIGLLSMKERAASLGGRLTINSSMGKGTAIRVELPVGRRRRV